MSQQEIYETCRLSGGEFREAIKAAIIKAHDAPSGHKVAVLLNTDTNEFSLSGYLSSSTTIGRGTLVDTFYFASWSIESSDYADYEKYGLTKAEAVANYAEDIADHQGSKALETLAELARDERYAY